MGITVDVSVLVSVSSPSFEFWSVRSGVDDGTALSTWNVTERPLVLSKQGTCIVH